MPKSIFDVVTAKNAKAFIEVAPKPEYLGEALFPSTKQLGLELSYLKGRGGLPIVLQPAAFDAKAPLRDRIGVESFNTEMPFFRERMLVKEKDRQQINTFLAGGQTQFADLILQEVFKDVDNLVAGALAQNERIRMQLLATGRIAVASTAEGAAYNYNYGLAPEQFETLAGADTWTHADANPIEQIEEWVEKSGATRAITNSTTFGLLRKNAKVLEAVSAVTGKAFVSKNEILNFFKEELGLSIAIYDEKFQASQYAAPEKFFPDYKFTLIPDGALGETVYGTTPEEADLLNKANGVDVEIVNQGIAIATVQQVHPVNVETIASMIALPSFPQADKIFIATVGQA